MYILGISCFYHDASAALLKDGKVVAAAGEERFTRIKNDSSFPINAIHFCLEAQKITIEDVEEIAFYEKPLLKFERVLYQFLESFPSGIKSFTRSMPSWFAEKVRITKIIRKKLKYKGNVAFVKHHLAHAASTFYPSPFNNAAILSVDGVGEWETTVFGYGKENKITLLKKINFPHSIGLLYSTITAYLGFRINSGEYKVMGLSAYGNQSNETNEYYKKIMNIIDVKDDGSFFFDMTYFSYHFKDEMYSKKLCTLLGGPRRKPSDEIHQRHKDIAAALQLCIEEILSKILMYVQKETKQKNIVLAGGVALNSAFNGKILKKTPFENVWIQPNPGDGGGSLGAALYVYHMVKKPEAIRHKMQHCFLGPLYSNGEIESTLERNNVAYSIFESEQQLVAETAKRIFEGNCIGWFQGRMEWGPRALGARSILANPCIKDMKKQLNIRIKHREAFRPFAPVVCEEDAKKVFEMKNLPKATEFMQYVAPIKKEFRVKIPAVTHVDGTGRLQTITKNTNPLLYKLIKEFEQLSKVPVLLNTSFNDNNEPIVCTPQDAIDCMKRTNIDYIVMENYLIKNREVH